MIPDDSTATILRRPYLLATVGSCALVFMVAFEAMAVTTIMPRVGRELNGLDLYALAFAAPLATSVVGMVVAGNWSDRRGPAGPLYASVVLFAAGLLIAGTALSMPVFVAGRFVQGLGGGAMTVALYVVIARAYPVRLHAKMFAAFAAVWVVPSMVGPFAAGVVAETVGWHWVFLGVVVLVVPALAMTVPALRQMRPGADPNPNAVPWNLGRIGWAVLAGVAVLALNLSGQIPAVGWAAAVVALLVALLAVRPLVPRGTLTAVCGLPSVILLRGVVSAAFFGAEVYMPYLLTERHGFSPAFAGLAITGSALAWATSSGIQGRWGSRISNAVAIRTGTWIVVAVLLLELAAVVFAWPPLPAIICWTFGGAGMGLMFPRLSTMTIALSAPDSQGFNSSALSISDSIGSALALAMAGMIFNMLASGYAFAGVFGLTAVIAVAGLLVSSRASETPTAERTVVPARS
ncbi:MFS transporter [Arthrobacter sp. SW1]|uniref:MFS transporter n=1 Tax=Arthrobacter sp. SW1 TaxID=1920889 RepID=UPI000877D25D|nr:MFS transporter [Arthrobacter sp. SW1]OFI38763.1 MFS transporter [Arthrobacter sp. SW1]